MRASLDHNHLSRELLCWHAIGRMASSAPRDAWDRSAPGDLSATAGSAPGPTEHTPRPVLFVPEGQGPRIDMVDDASPADGGEDEYLGRNDWGTLYDLRSSHPIPVEIAVDPEARPATVPQVPFLPPPLAQRAALLTFLKATAVLVVTSGLVYTSLHRLLPPLTYASIPFPCHGLIS